MKINFSNLNFAVVIVSLLYSAVLKQPMCLTVVLNSGSQVFKITYRVVFQSLFQLSRHSSQPLLVEKLV